MADNLEVALRNWEIEISLKESEQFRQNVAEIFRRTGFVRQEKYWENVDMGGFRIYETYKHTGCSTETLYLLMKSPRASDGIPPVIDLLERAIRSQKWVSFKENRDFEYT